MESTKKLSQRIKFHADSSQSLEHILASGGKLLGVKSVSSNLHETAFGDAAYPVVEENDLSVRVLNGPTKDAAKGILEKLWAKIRSENPKRVTVTIEDTVEDKLKTINIDVSKGNILENIFIRQCSLGHLDFSLFSAVQGRFGGLKPAGSGLLECSAA